MIDFYESPNFALFFRGDFNHKGKNKVQTTRNMYNQSAHSQLLKKYNELSLYQIGKTELSEFSRYVFQQYAYHYHKKYDWEAPASQLVEMQLEDQECFDHAHFFGFRTAQGKLVGSMKITQKAPEMLLPIEEDFQLDLNELIRKRDLKANAIWHLGRFAVDTNELRTKKIGIASKEVLRLLLIHAFEKMDKDGNDLLVAESDVLIYKLFHSLGINMQLVGEAKMYIGSPTYPVMITGQDIKQWLAMNTASEDEVLMCD